MSDKHKPICPHCSKSEMVSLRVDSEFYWCSWCGSLVNPAVSIGRLTPWWAWNHQKYQQYTEKQESTQ